MTDMGQTTKLGSLSTLLEQVGSKGVKSSVDTKGKISNTEEGGSGADNVISGDFTPAPATASTQQVLAKNAPDSVDLTPSGNNTETSSFSYEELIRDAIEEAQQTAILRARASRIVDQQNAIENARQSVAGTVDRAAAEIEGFTENVSDKVQRAAAAVQEAGDGEIVPIVKTESGDGQSGIVEVEEIKQGEGIVDETGRPLAKDPARLTEAELTEAEKNQVKKLQARDREVRSHEAAHVAAGGGVVRGGAQFSFQKGPDGKQYAVGGEVPIDASPVPGDPEATIRKMEAVARAAKAPAKPSKTDMQVAAAASLMAQRARMEMMQQELQKAKEKIDDTHTKPDIAEEIGLKPKNGDIPDFVSVGDLVA